VPAKYPHAAPSEWREQQRAYYARTAQSYSEWHFKEGGHQRALEQVALFAVELGAQSVLDTRRGTGRGVKFFLERFPDLTVRGNDPSRELLDVSGLPSDLVDCCSSERLPYGDAEFDFVVELGVLHHVADPAPIVDEMLRVARKGVFLSDSNIYGRGPGLLKLILRALGLWSLVLRARRGGKLWFYSEGDCIAFSYSVFDSYRQLRASCRQVLAIPL